MPPITGVYHTHTHRCQHASGEVVDYALAARSAGLLRIAATDHGPLPGGRWQEVRMRPDQLAGYEAAVAQAQDAVPEVGVLLGMECDIDRDLFGWYRDTYRARGYRCLIASCHYVTRDGVEVSAFEDCGTPATLRDCAARTVGAIASGLFDFVGHPDVFGSCNHAWNADTAACARDICTAAAAHGVPLELNSLGLRRGDIDTMDGRRARYPWRPFWEIAAAHGCAAVLSSDAHRPEDVAVGLDRIAALAAELGIRVVDPFA